MGLPPEADKKLASAIGFIEAGCGDDALFARARARTTGARETRARRRRARPPHTRARAALPRSKLTAIEPRKRERTSLGGASKDSKESTTKKKKK